MAALSSNGQQRESAAAVPEAIKSTAESDGLVLDDFLFVIDEFRRRFKLRNPKFGLPKIEQNKPSREAIKRIIDDCIGKHGAEIYSRPYLCFANIASA